ncbi:hypothetical protein NDU88_000276 [Pleurodeles waltl]|uniref:Uncharacterized protein n=1 Tax=Pleurodeles waltl TaxID=8319 RepID=A0AAV7USN2_PLEWA|nr:hypothetical protein NDU88_000276 [Pleurodeles waltl]
MCRSGCPQPSPVLERADDRARHAGRPAALAAAENMENALPELREVRWTELWPRPRYCSNWGHGDGVPLNGASNHSGMPHWRVQKWHGGE